LIVNSLIPSSISRFCLICQMNGIMQRV